MKTSLILVAALAFGIATPSSASELGWESQSSFTVSVTIAPLGAALAASAGGAQGLWTIGGGGRGLMVQAPKDIGPGEAGEFALFAADTGALTLTSSSPDLEVSRFGTKMDNGLGRLVFKLKAGDFAANDHSRTVVISTL